MFLQVSVILFMGGSWGDAWFWEGDWSRGGAWSRGVCSWGVSAPGGAWSWGGLLPGGCLVETPGQLLLRVVRILLESMLVEDRSLSRKATLQSALSSFVLLLQYET